MHNNQYNALKVLALVILIAATGTFIYHNIIKRSNINAGSAIGTTNTPMQNPTFVPSLSDAAQYILAETTIPQQLGSHATFNFKNTGSVATIKELLFSANGPTTISSVNVNNTTNTPVISGKAHVTGLNIAVPNGGTGVNISTQIKYANVDPAGITSGTPSTLSLVALKYMVGTASFTMCVPGVMSSCTSQMNPVSASTMTLVGSLPALVLSSPMVTFAPNHPVLITKAIFSGYASSSLPYGTDTYRINQFPLTVMPTNVALSALPNAFVLKDATTGAVIPTTSTAIPATGGTTIITFPNGYLINHLVQVKIYVLASSIGTSGGTPPGTAVIKSSLGPRPDFQWIDVIGGGTAILNGVGEAFYHGDASPIIVHN